MVYSCPQATWSDRIAYRLLTEVGWVPGCALSIADGELNSFRFRPIPAITNPRNFSKRYFHLDIVNHCLLFLPGHRVSLLCIYPDLPTCLLLLSPICPLLSPFAPWTPLASHGLRHAASALHMRTYVFCVFSNEGVNKIMTRRLLRVKSRRT